MRGIAAFAVVCFHLRPGWFPSAYLAVDLFFILSGFVLAHAYGRKFDDGLSWTAFMKARVVRLWPLNALAVAMMCVDQGVAGKLHATIALPQFFFVPVLGTTSEPLYPMNIPAWSLLFEMIVNFAWAVGWAFLRLYWLPTMVGLAAIAFVSSIIAHGSADLGCNWQTSVFGLVRAAYGFTAGLGLYACRGPGRDRPSPRICGILLVALATILLIKPLLPLRVPYDVIVTLGAAPLLVWLAAKFEPSEMGARIFSTLGTLSYPLYAIHWPLLQITEELTERYHIARAVEHAAYLFALIPLALALGLTYDPWLRKRLLAIKF